MFDFRLLLGKFAFLALLYIFIFWALAVMRRAALRPAAYVEDALALKIQITNGPAVFLTENGLIGRAPGCEIQLNDPAASAKHARLTKEKHYWFIEDIQSGNGTFVNNERLNDRRRINSGDRIRIGRTELVIGPIS